METRSLLDLTALGVKTAIYTATPATTGCRPGRQDAPTGSRRDDPRRVRGGCEIAQASDRRRRPGPLDAGVGDCEGELDFVQVRVQACGEQVVLHCTVDAKAPDRFVCQLVELAPGGCALADAGPIRSRASVEACG